MTAVRVLQFTDTHLVGDPSGRQRGVVALDALRAVVRQARRDPVDLILLTGDLVHDDPAGYAWLRREFEGDVPVLCIPGNHDDPQAFRRAFAAPPFQVAGHHDAGAWRLVMLDSHHPGHTGGRLTDEELRRLETALREASDRHALVVLHHHPVAMGSAWLDTIGLDEAQPFFAVIDRHPSVRGILWGHVHQALDAVHRPSSNDLPREVALMATPSTCVQFRPNTPDFDIDDRPPGYRRLVLHDDGRIESQVEWLTRPA